jgi:hypothetical protein
MVLLRPLCSRRVSSRTRVSRRKEKKCVALSFTGHHGVERLNPRTQRKMRYRVARRSLTMTDML